MDLQRVSRPYWAMTKSLANSFSPLSEYTIRPRIVLTDIDDTLTDDGRLGPQAYRAMWDLQTAGIRVLPVTGRPAGWCEMIARQWPVIGVIGENGGFYFHYDRVQKKMRRSYAQDLATRERNQQKLRLLSEKILQEFTGAALASDQFCRQIDLAVDFCEDVPRLDWAQVEQIAQRCREDGATVKISSIHVNTWFGQHDKLTMSLKFLDQELRLTAEQAKSSCAFVGDSPNDEPMWAYFPNSFAVANVLDFKDQLKSAPRFITRQKGGAGFHELAEHFLSLAK